jgi:hypothetical protein
MLRRARRRRVQCEGTRRPEDLGEPLPVERDVRLGRMLRATPFDERRRHGATVYSRSGVQPGN